MQGKPIREVVPGKSVRAATESDVKSCNAICKTVHGHDRNGELKDSIKQGIAKVVLQGDKITGYSSGLTYFNHSVGLTNDDLKALISSATDSYGGPGILVPSRNTQLFRWCLNNGLRLVQQLTLMTIGLYSEPAGSYAFDSILSFIMLLVALSCHIFQNRQVYPALSFQLCPFKSLAFRPDFCLWVYNL